MDEKMRRQEAQEYLRWLPEEDRARMLREVERELLDANPGTSPSEIRVEGLGLAALSEEVLVRGLARLFADFHARISEHVAAEDLRRWLYEEMRRLQSDYPEGVPEDVLVDAVVKRMEQEHSQNRRGLSGSGPRE